MLSFRNNPSVSLFTRRWLSELAENNSILDNASMDLMFPAIDAVSQIHPGGTVYDLAIDLGAREIPALTAASAAEMFYAVCSLTDDLQDGDSDSYYGTTPYAMRLNAQSHLFCLAALRQSDLIPFLSNQTSDFDFYRDLFFTGAVMLNGQRLELECKTWTLPDYKRVADQSAGEQVAFYFGLAAAIAGQNTSQWKNLGRSIGIIGQLISDKEVGDIRYISIPSNEMSTFWESSINDLKQASAPLNQAASYILEIFSKCPPEYI